MNSGVAQERYGIGAQIVVPYTDPFNNTDYELPFNFGTFTAYGEGKLGLQAHYAVPTALKRYGEKTYNSYYSDWKDSYIYSWLNNDTTTVDYRKDWHTDISFLECIPGNFAETINSIDYGLTQDTAINTKVFLPGVVNSCASLEPVGNYTVHPFYGDDIVWEYWQNKIGTPQKYGEYGRARKVSTITTRSSSHICLPNKISTPLSYAQCAFNEDSGYFTSYSCDAAGTYLPACIIG